MVSTTSTLWTSLLIYSLGGSANTDIAKLKKDLSGCPKKYLVRVKGLSN